MKYVLRKKPKGATIIQGFPCIGLVSTITTKFLLDHLKVEQIGHFESERLVPLTAIHNAQVVEPISVYYNQKYNIVVIQALAEVKGIEWELADAILKMASELKAKEIISIEGTPGQSQNLSVFFHSNKNKKLNIQPMQDGIIMGVTAAMLLKSESKMPITCLFGETHSALPDSESAANVIKVLDDYLKLKVDFKPLLAQAKVFEEKLKQFVSKAQESQQASMGKKENVSYFG